MSYWDIDSFLTEEQKIQCTFVKEAPKMEFIDPSKGIVGKVPAQLPLHVPIWLATTLQGYLFQGEEDALVDVQVPKFLKKDQLDDYFNAVESDRRAKLQDINLQEKSSHFYNIYNDIKRILPNTPNLIDGERVKNVGWSRGQSIINRASTFQEESKAECRLHNYTENERQLFKLTRKKCEQYHRWECQSKKIK